MIIIMLILNICLATRNNYNIEVLIHEGRRYLHYLLLIIVAGIAKRRLPRQIITKDDTRYNMSLTLPENYPRHVNK